MSDNKCQPNDAKQLMGLISLRQLEGVKEILEQSKNCINNIDKYGTSPILMSAKRNDLEMMKFLESKGANISNDNLEIKKWAKYYDNKDMILFIDKKLNENKQK